MKRKKKKVVKSKLSMSSKVEEQKFSFDLPSIILIGAVCYYIRESITEKSVELVTNKQCIPVEVIKKAIIELGFKRWLDQIPEDE